MARALLITNPAAARTRPARGGRGDAHHCAARLEARGARHRRPRRRAPARRSTAWPKGWTSWRSSAATAPRCRRPPRWWAPRWRWASSRAAPATCWRGTCGFPPRRPAPPGRWSRRGPGRSTWGGWSGPMARTTSPWPAARATTPGSWPRRSREHKRRWGMAAYVGHDPPPHRRASGARDHIITIDGVEYDANAAMVLVANCGEVIPPFVRLGAGIRPDDGLLDVVVVRANGFGQSVRAVWDLLRDGPRRSTGWRPTWLCPRPGDPGRDRAGRSRCSSTGSPAARRRSPPPSFRRRSGSWCPG